MEKANNKPIIKNTRRKLKPLAMLSTFIFACGGVFTIAEAGREVYEEITSENMLVNFGPYVLNNKDDRTQVELLNAVHNAILNMEGIEKIYSPDLTTEQKQEIIERLINTISKEANILTDDIKSRTPSDSTSSGFYYSNTGPGFIITSGKIYINPEEYNKSEFPRIVEIVIHEMIHAIYYENFYVNKNLSEFDKQLLSNANILEDDSYFSSFKESNVYFFCTNIMNSLTANYNPPILAESYVYDYVVFSEMMGKLYNKNYTVPLVVENIDKSIKSLDTFKENSGYYYELTLKELFLMSYKQKLEIAGLDYINVNLEETDYYKVFEQSFSEQFLNLKYSDLASGNFQVSSKENFSINSQKLSSETNNKSSHIMKKDVLNRIAKIINKNELDEELSL